MTTDRSDWCQQTTNNLSWCRFQTNSYVHNALHYYAKIAITHSFITTFHIVLAL